MACKHLNLTVRQDPNDQDRELLACPDCDMEPKRRVSAAASIKAAADARLAEMGDRLERQTASHAGEVETLRADIAALNDRLYRIESFNGVA